MHRYFSGRAHANITPPPLVKRYTDNLEAYNLFLKGRFEVYKMTREGLVKSKQHFEAALALDPGYALAFDGLAYANYTEGFLGFVAPREAMPLAEAAAPWAMVCILCAALSSAARPRAAFNTHRCARRRRIIESVP